MIGECFILLIVLVNKSKKDSTYSEQYVQEELHHISIPRCYYDSGNSKYSRTAIVVPRCAVSHNSDVYSGAAYRGWSFRRRTVLQTTINAAVILFT